jgi:CRISPR-associated exonuclease Cas4
VYGDDELLPLSGLQHLSYCERQWALIHVEGQWEDNLETVRGEFFHGRVDVSGYSTVRGYRAERTVHLVSYELGIYGIADIVEYALNSNVQPIRPVEYKVGKSKSGNWDRIQVAAQAMCLEEMTGERIEEAAIFYGEARHREVVTVKEPLREEVRSASKHMHEMFELRTVPPAHLSAKCRRCSLADVCLPVCDNMSTSMYWKGYGIDFSEANNETLA